MTITYQKGDLFDHVQHGDRIIHVCNNIGGWGSGFVVPLGKKYPIAEQAYRKWFIGENFLTCPHISISNDKPTLGNIQCIRFHERGELYIVNMIAQNGVVNDNNRRPLNYEALYECLRKISLFIPIDKTHRIIGPKLGAGLAGGDWNIIEAMINSVFRGNQVTIFEL